MSTTAAPLTRLLPPCMRYVHRIDIILFHFLECFLQKESIFAAVEDFAYSNNVASISQQLGPENQDDDRTQLLAFHAFLHSLPCWMSLQQSQKEGSTNLFSSDQDQMSMDQHYSYLVVINNIASFNNNESRNGE